MEKSPKKWLTTFLLCTFLGYQGAHRFYVGKTGSGVAQLLLDWTGIWCLIDWIKILCQKFTDKEGNVIAR